MTNLHAALGRLYVCEILPESKRLRLGFDGLGDVFFDEADAEYLYLRLKAIFEPEAAEAPVGAQS